MSKASFVFLWTLLLCMGAGYSTQSAHAKRRKRAKRIKVEKKKTPPPFTADERELMEVGGRDFVLKLRSTGYSAGDYLKAFNSTRGAVKLYKQGSYGDAIFLFIRAFRLIPSPTIQYWMGQTYLSFGNVVKAKDSFDAFISLAPKWTLTPIKKAYITEAKEKIAQLKSSLVALRVTTNVNGAEIVVNGEVLRYRGKSVKTPYDGIIWLKPGFTALVFAKKGYVNKELLIKDAKKGQSFTKHVVLLTPKELIQKSRLYLTAQKAKRDQEMKRAALWKKYQLQRQEAELKAKIRKKSVRFFGYATIGAGVALLLTGGALGWSAQNTANDIEASAKAGISWDELKEDYDRFDRRRNIAFFATGIGATVLFGGLVITYFGYLEPNVKMKTPFDYILSSTPFKRKVRVTPMFGGNSLGLNVDIPF